MGAQTQFLPPPGAGSFKRLLGSSAKSTTECENSGGDSLQLPGFHCENNQNLPAPGGLMLEGYFERKRSDSES